MLGNVAVAIDSASESSQLFRLKLDYVKRFMRNTALPSSLQSRVHQFYSYRWSSSHGYNDMEILSSLPTTLRTDVALALTQYAIQAVTVE